MIEKVITITGFHLDFHFQILDFRFAGLRK